MKTQKRFTAALLQRFERDGRGTGSFENYLPWHRVGRSDPSSRGRSHLINWRGRHYELLSDAEWVGFLFSTLMPNVEDIREQFKLSLKGGQHELADYDIRFAGQDFPGTLACSELLKTKHPKLKRRRIRALGHDN